MVSGDVYEGDFVKYMRHGKGKIIYANGKVEEGNWENNQFLGELKTRNKKQ
jgi:hypothetical protein